MRKDNMKPQDIDRETEHVLSLLQEVKQEAQEWAEVLELPLQAGYDVLAIIYDPTAPNPLALEMEDRKTWRDLLGEIISDPQEKQRIAQCLNINPITLSRWCAGTTTPRYDNIRPLLDSLPEYRQQLAESLVDDFPRLFNESVEEEVRQPEIPSAFYGRVLNVSTSSPLILRSASIIVLILQQMLAHLDPTQQGMAVMIIQCMRPDEQKKIRSLRKTYGRGTISSASYDYETQFFGAESPVGQAIASGHPIILQCSDEKIRHFPGQSIPQEESSVAYPILRTDRIAGCLQIVSNQPYYFTQTRLDPIQAYADLLTLAFEPEEFYDFSQIELGIMPKRQLQQKHLADFQERTIQKMFQAVWEKQSLSRFQAESLVWQELERELLDLVH